MHRRHAAIGVGLIAVLLVAACAPAAAPRPTPAPGVTPGPEEEEPQHGGELTFLVSADPPSFDAHAETTFAMLHPVSPHYSLLLRFDPFNYPEIIPDVAASMPEISTDGLTYTFQLRTDVRFHDGSLMTARDVVATYNKIVFPPEGVRSARRGAYAAVESIEATGEHTVVFRLRHVSASMLANFASPWNYIYKADIIEADPKAMETQIMGTGPFKFAEYERGSHWVGERNPDYFDQPKPYLDGYTAIFTTDAAAQETAIQGERALIEFRGFTPSVRDNLVRNMGDKIRVQESNWICNLYLAINNQRPPFDDVRVRQALSLALDRWEGSEALSQIAIVRGVGGLMRPGGPFAQSDSQLQEIPGFGTDGAANKDRARELLREAGAEGLTFTLLNRNIVMPYEHVAVFMIDQWRQIGLNVEHVQKETTPYLADLRGADYDVGVDFNCDFMDEPDLQLVKFLSASGGGAGLNYSNYDDARIDQLYEQQSREQDPERRKEIVWEFERYAMWEQAYQFPIIWWYRIIPHNSRVRGWEITPSHYVNQDLSTVWLGD